MRAVRASRATGKHEPHRDHRDHEHGPEVGLQQDQTDRDAHEADDHGDAPRVELAAELAKRIQT